MSSESNLTVCKVCGELKERIHIGLFNDKDKKYVDLSNKLWNGLCCPPCNQKRCKENMKKKRQVIS